MIFGKPKAKESSLEQYIFDLEETEKIKIEVGKSKNFKFCSLHWDNQFQKYNIALYEMFPYLGSYKAIEVAQELKKVAGICEEINDLLP